MDFLLLEKGFHPLISPVLIEGTGPPALREFQVSLHWLYQWQSSSPQAPKKQQNHQQATAVLPERNPGPDSVQQNVGQRKAQGEFITSLSHRPQAGLQPCQGSAQSPQDQLEVWAGHWATAICLPKAHLPEDHTAAHTYYTASYYTDPPSEPRFRHCSHKLTVGTSDASAHWCSYTCLISEGNCENQLNTAPLPQAASCWLRWRQKLFTQENLWGLSCNPTVLTAKCSQRWIFDHVLCPHVVQLAFCFVNRHAPKLSQKSWISWCFLLLHSL